MTRPSRHGLVVAILAVFYIAGTGEIQFDIEGIVGTIFKLTDGQCDSCTLTVMCWMNGGTRTKEAGCPGPSWLTTCCASGVTRSEDPRPLSPGLRSNPGGAPFIIANTIGESIANFGRDDCKPLILYRSFYSLL